VEQLTEDDTVSIVTYAGGTGVHLAPTNGMNKTALRNAIDQLNSGGSTNGSAGIMLAYQQAKQGFIDKGANRVLLCTDGDLNVGITSDEALVQLITKEAKSGVFLTVLGFGTGNLKDSKMEKLADHGNGMYAYIDSLREGHKVLVEQMSGSLVTIAKDVKIQIEFNPAQVAAYRLIGYENRLLAAKDFNDDRKDAGEIGAGHSVTALYELVPAGARITRGDVDPLKYQPNPTNYVPSENTVRTDITTADVNRELLTLKLRYKQPDGDTSRLLEFALQERQERFGAASSDFRFAAAVAAFGMLLRHSPHSGDITLEGAGEIAAAALGNDPQGHRAEFLDLIRKASSLGAK
jgi:secreted protein with Ig-like and vWFA domain